MVSGNDYFPVIQFVKKILSLTKLAFPGPLGKVAANNEKIGIERADLLYNFISNLFLDCTEM